MQVEQRERGPVLVVLGEAVREEPGVELEQERARGLAAVQVPGLELELELEQVLGEEQEPVAEAVEEPVLELELERGQGLVLVEEQHLWVSLQVYRPVAYHVRGSPKFLHYI